MHVAHCYACEGGWIRKKRGTYTFTRPCDICGGTGNPTLPGMENVPTERAEAIAIAEGEALTAEMRKPLKSISQAAGRMERESPLFFGTGTNPTLF